MSIKCMMCGKPAKWIKVSETQAPRKIEYGFCSKVCMGNKMIKFRKLKRLKE